MRHCSVTISHNFCFRAFPCSVLIFQCSTSFFQSLRPFRKSSFCFLLSPSLILSLIPSLITSASSDSPRPGCSSFRSLPLAGCVSFLSLPLPSWLYLFSSPFSVFLFFPHDFSDLFLFYEIFSYSKELIRIRFLSLFRRELLFT